MDINPNTELGKLSEQDQEVLLRAPAVVALLAAISDDGEVSLHERSEAIKLAHLRTYTSPEILHNFYKEVDKVFEDYLEDEFKKLPASKAEKAIYLAKRLEEINQVLPKLNKVYKKELVVSLKSFARHVFKSNSGFLEHFLLPIFLGRIERQFFDPKIGE